MKVIVLGIILLGFAGSALAIERSDLDMRIWRLTEKFEEMQARPETAIPAAVLKDAKGIILLDRTKAGFLVAFQGGSGVAMMRDAKGENWSPVAFMGVSDISLGLQAGGEQGFYAIVLMDENAGHLLNGPNYEYGSEVRGTAGDASGGARATTSALKTSVLVYSEHKGLFGGADLSGGGIVPDDKADYIYYGRAYTVNDILFGNEVKPTDAAKALAEQLEIGSKPAQVSAGLR